MNTNEKKAIKEIVLKMSEIKGTSFIGIKAYESKTSGEIANHVVNVGFSYGNAVEKDIEALKNITSEQIEKIASKGFSVELINTAVSKLLDSFIANQNKETQSNQSIGQQAAYLTINNTTKLCLATGQIHIYAMAINKQVLKAGEYKNVNSRELTLCQNEVKKVLNFSTSKYRQFIVSKENLTAVKMQGEIYTTC